VLSTQAQATPARGRTPGVVALGGQRIWRLESVLLPSELVNLVKSLGRLDRACTGRPRGRRLACWSEAGPLAAAAAVEVGGEALRGGT
jgi:hypothetical protein